MAQVEIPLVQPFKCKITNSGNDATVSVDSYVLNGMLIKEPSGEVIVQKRRGFKQIESDTDHTIGYGIFNWQALSIDRLLFVAHDTVSAGATIGYIASGVFNDLVSLSGTPVGIVKWTQSSDGPYVLVNVVDSTTECCYFIDNTPTAIKLTNATHGFPSGNLAAGICELDKYIFVAQRDGKIYNSDVGDITTWISSNFLSAEREDDVTEYICKHDDHICVVGTRSIEFFYNANTPLGSPLTRREDVYYTIGVASAGTTDQTGSIDSDDTYVAFIGQDRRSGTVDELWQGIYLIDNMQLRKISTEEMDMLGYNATDTVRIMKYRGREFIVVNGIEANISMVYDIKYGFWYKWDMPELSSNVAMGAFDGAVSIGSSNALVYQMEEINTDGDPAGTPTTYNLEIITDELDFGTYSDKFIRSLSLYGDNLTGGTISVSWSDDGGTTYNTARDIDMDTWNTLHRIGSTKKRKFKFVNTDSDLVTLRKAYADIIGGVSPRQAAG